MKKWAYKYLNGVAAIAGMSFLGGSANNRMNNIGTAVAS